MKSVIAGALLAAFTLSGQPHAPFRGLLHQASPLAAVERLETISTLDGEGGSRLVLLRAGAADGAATRIRFSRFHLPQGAAVYVFGVAEGGSVLDVQGPFTGNGPLHSGRFAAGAVRGTAYIEYQMGGKPAADLPFAVVGVEPASLEETGEQTAAAENEVRTGFYRGANLTFAVRDGEALFENDIELGPAHLIEPVRPAAKGRRESMAILGNYYRWPNGVMPYTIDPAFGDTSRVTAAIDHWNTRLAGTVLIVPRTTESNYVVFRSASDAGRCSSSVGMLGWGSQSINLGAWCSVGNVIHEIGHALGLWHEQSRIDRDQHVRINWANIQSTATYNFNQQTSDGIDLGAYDYGSIMHYNAYAFSANGQPTIETIPVAGIPIGQRDSLSAGDIAGIQAIYSTGSPVPPPAPPPVQPPAQPQTVAVTVQSNPAGVPLTVNGVVSTAAVTNQWVPGTTQTLSAPDLLDAAGTRTAFVKWNDGGAATHTVTVPSVASIYTADFSRSHRLAVTGAAGGTVAVSPLSSDGYYAENTSVALTASADPGYCFAGWTGLLGGTPADTSVVVTRPLDVAPGFQPGSYLLNRTSAYVTRRGGSANVSVKTGVDCSWAVQSLDSWLTVDIASGSGNGSMTITAAPNTTGRSRVGRVQVAGLYFMVVQLG